MDAYQFSKPVRENLKTSYNFGTSNSDTAAALRDLADRLDKHEIALQGIKVLSIAGADDFTKTVLRISFSEQRANKNAGATKRLLGDSTLPVEIAKVSDFFGESTRPSEDFKHNVDYGEALKNLMGL